LTTSLRGHKGEHLPYSLDGPSLSKQDNATDEERPKCQKYPYRRGVGQLMYGMVHTRVTIMYALDVLSQYGNDQAHQVPHTPAQVSQVCEEGPPYLQSLRREA
jgi:hypothetical protein